MEYKINLTNKSSSPKRYLLFIAARRPTNGPSGQVFFNVYDCSPRIEPGDNVTWNCAREYYAIYGTAESSSSGKNKVVTSASQRVSLGPGGSSIGFTVDDERGPSFRSSGRQASEPGAFAIETGSFRYPNDHQVYIGIGAPNPRGSRDDIRPLQTYQAEPNLNSRLFPAQTYYVCTGDYQAGVLLDPNSIGRAVKIDFSRAQMNEVKLYQDDSGNYRDPDSGRSGVSVEMTDVRG